MLLLQLFQAGPLVQETGVIVGDAKVAHPGGHGRGVQAGDNRDLNARLLGNFNTQAVLHVKAFHHLILQIVIEPAVREHSIDIQHQQADIQSGLNGKKKAGKIILHEADSTSLKVAAKGRAARKDANCWGHRTGLYPGRGGIR